VFNTLSEMRRKESQGENNLVREATVQRVSRQAGTGLQVPAQPRGGENGLEFLHSVEEAERNTCTNAGCSSLPSLYVWQIHLRPNNYL
jgi:hypothetical protein